MEIYTEATSAATRDALNRLGEELSPHDDDDGQAVDDPRRGRRPRGRRPSKRRGRQ
jgi:hypothetical protein